jgi:hypothetical protein
MFVSLLKPLKFWVEKVLEKWMPKLSSIHIRQCPFAILWQGFLVAYDFFLSYFGESGKHPNVVPMEITFMDMEDNH